jgi:hypothetical protein
MNYVIYPTTLRGRLQQEEAIALDNQSGDAAAIAQAEDLMGRDRWTLVREDGTVVWSSLQGGGVHSNVRRDGVRERNFRGRQVARRFRA